MSSISSTDRTPVQRSKTLNPVNSLMLGSAIAHDFDGRQYGAAKDKKNMRVIAAPCPMRADNPLIDHLFLKVTI
jgi:hypothetical protein